MAAHACGGGSLELSTCMARRALKPRMRPGQRESSGYLMIETRPDPVVHLVALLASRGETRGYMAWRSRCQVIVRMAGIALRG